MIRRIATTSQMFDSVVAAGYEAVLLPALPNEDIHRGLAQRLSDGSVYEPFLRASGADLILDVDTGALTLSPVPGRASEVRMTCDAVGIPYVCLYIDPVTSTMNQVPWLQHWALLSQPCWIKAVWESAHLEELTRLGVPNVVHVPMAIHDTTFDLSPPTVRYDGPVVAFMGHPASSWFLLPRQLLPGLTAAAVNADAPGTPFHRTYFDLYGFGEGGNAADSVEIGARRAAEYFNTKFVYNAYLALRQRDRFAVFLQKHLGERFELVGDHWEKDHGLHSLPTIRDRAALIRRMREVPICLNLVKGCLESGLNLRHFEVTAAGGFLLTYWTPDLPKFFEPGKECETFRSETELLTKVRYYLENRAQRDRIAAAGQRRTLREHLYSHRIRDLVKLLDQAGVTRRGQASGVEKAVEADSGTNVANIVQPIEYVQA
ncbi:MAG: glycosyltransferase family 1 protein [Planctomycetota bacterium]|nr:MAG: glycosyltransferase family 1 protein [Planctomycetota bacterium]